jgi:hypothetical protein
MWQHGFGSSGYESVQNTVADAAGNVYITGFYFGTVDFNPSTTAQYNLTSKGDKDAFVVKLNANGTFAWARGFGTSQSNGSTQYDEGKTIKIDPAGNVIVGGSFMGDTCYFYSSTATTNTLLGLGQQDGVIAKYNGTNGNIIFTENFGGVNAGAGGDGTRLEDLDVDVNGNIYVIGYFYGNVDLDPGTGVVSYNSLIGSFGDPSADMFLSKFNSNGQFVFGRKMGGYETDYALSIDITNSGNIYFTGVFSKLCDFDGTATGFQTLQTTSNSTNDLDAFLCKYDTAGNYIWAKKIGGSGSQFGYGVAADENGKIFVGGTFGGTAFANEGGTNVDTLLNSGINDIFISGWDSQGELNWAHKIGGATSDICNDLVIDDASNVYITGYFYSFNIDFDPGAGQMILHPISIATSNNDLYLAKYNSNGDAIWARGFGDSTAGDQGNALAIAPGTNAIILAGQSSGTSIDFDPTSLTSIFTSNGSIDGFLVKYSACQIGRSVVKDTLLLQADPGYAAYQWIDCNTNLPIAGATQNTFTPVKNGNYAVVITGSEGCVDTTDCVTVDNLIECTISNTLVKFEQTLYAQSLPNASYQWVVCPTYANITSNGNDSLYTPNLNASFACIITLDNGCKDTTECKDFFDVGINNYGIEQHIQISPNPAQNILNLKVGNAANYAVKISNVSGEEVMNIGKINANISTIEVSELARGVYFLSIQNLNTGSKSHYRFIKE